VADRAPTVVQLMAEHTDVFLWNRSPDRGPEDDYELRPAELGVSPGLAERLSAWNEEYGRLALRPDVAFESPEEAASWRRAGLHLAHALQDELGPDIEVRYAEDGDPRPVRERRGS